MHGQEGVEEIGKADAVGLGQKPEQVAVAVEAPRAAGLGDFAGRLAVSVQELIPELASGVPRME